MRRVGRALAPIALLATAASCYVWRVETVPGASAGYHSLGAEVQLTFRNGREVSLRNAGVQGDSVVGYAMTTEDRLAYPVRDVQEVKSWRYSGGRTAGLVIGLLAGVTAVALAAVISIFSSAAY